jgi:hypothetical protein
MMTTIFSRIGPYALGRAACVCRQWRFLARVSHSTWLDAAASSRLRDLQYFDDEHQYTWGRAAAATHLC